MNNEKNKGFNKNILLCILAIPILVAVGVIIGGYYIKDNAQIVSGSEEREEAFEEVSVPLEEFVLNLEPTSNINHYIRFEVSLSSTKENGEEIINSNLNKIRDEIIRTVSSQSVEEIFDDESGTILLKDLLKQAINETLEDDVIYEVYITNIVVQ